MAGCEDSSTAKFSAYASLMTSSTPRAGKVTHGPYYIPCAMLSTDQPWVSVAPTHTHPVTHQRINKYMDVVMDFQTITR